jgi:hypothetical protein
MQPLHQLYLSEMRTAFASVVPGRNGPSLKPQLHLMARAFARPRVPVQWPGAAVVRIAGRGPRP